MSPEEVLERAQGGYVAGLVSLARMERYIDLALAAERRSGEVDYMQVIGLPFSWTIARALLSSGAARVS